MTLGKLFGSILIVSFLSGPVVTFADDPVDTTPPTITAPANQSFGTTTFPAFPTLIPATATDDLDPSPVITYDPTSFPLGITQVTWTATDASGNTTSATSSVEITDSTPPAPISDTITLTIRDGATTAFSGTINLPDVSAPDIAVTPTGSTSTVNVSARSVLATLMAVDSTSTDFDITDLTYYSSYGSFIINCIAVPSSTTPDCFSWTYAVNGNFPLAGVDDQVLQNGDVVHLFFGPSRQTVLSMSTVETGTSFTASAQYYDLSTGNYVPLTGVTLGVGTANPDFSFTELATSTVDSSGQAIFTLSATGTFSAGIQQDFYYPAASITVTDPTPTPPPSGGGGGGNPHQSLNMINALSFISSNQQQDGSFGSAMITDWTAIAFAAADPGAAKTKLKNYLVTAAPAMSSITDYERHAMALEALGINPYNGTSVDYITPIVQSFDGTQIGLASSFHDDIFAFFPLLNAGYAPTDPMLHKVATFIISKQSPNGSWGDADTTAAAIQALGALFGPSGFSQSSLGASLGRAQGYLMSTQQTDGGWLNIDSTSWAQTMINAMNALDPNRASLWPSSAGQYPTDSIARAQGGDGAVRLSTDQTDTRVWSTGYAVMAASGKSWLNTLTRFPKPTSATSGGGGGGGSVLGAATSTTATSTSATSTPATTASSTAPVATTTAATASSTPEIILTSGTSTAMTPTQPSQPKKPVTVKPKPKDPPPQPTAPETEQETPAEAPPQSSALSKVWGAVKWFFSKIF